MVDKTTQPPAAQTADAAAVDPVYVSIAALEARVMELETVVQAFIGASHGQVSTVNAHGAVLPWLEKISARIKAAAEKVL